MLDPSDDDVTDGGPDGVGHTITWNEGASVPNPDGGDAPAPGDLVLIANTTETDVSDAQRKRRGPYVLTEAGEQTILVRSPLWDEGTDTVGVTHFVASNDGSSRKNTRWYVDGGESGGVFGTTNWVISLFRSNSEIATVAETTRITAARADIVGPLRASGDGSFGGRLTFVETSGNEIVRTGDIPENKWVRRVGSQLVGVNAPVQRWEFPGRNLSGDASGGQKSVNLGNGRTHATLPGVGLSGFVVTKDATVKAIYLLLEGTLPVGSVVTWNWVSKNNEYVDEIDATETGLLIIDTPFGVQEGDSFSVLAEFKPGVGSGAYDLWCSASVEYEVG